MIDHTYDVYEWINPRIKSKGKKKVGKKTCRFVQPHDGSKSIIPNILRKLLGARKSTRKKIKFETITTKKGDTYSGLVKEDKETSMITIIDGDGAKHEFNKSEVISKKQTFTEFEQSVFDGLQLAYKLTTNSLYGQIGAQTSPIYFKDIAASTTATNGFYI